MSMLEQGTSSSITEGYRSTPFFNPHFIVRAADRVELQRRNFRKLFDIADVYQVNITREPFEQVQQRLCHLLTGNEEQALV